MLEGATIYLPSYSTQFGSYVYNPSSIPLEPTMPPNNIPKIYGGYPSLESGMIPSYKKDTRKIQISYVQQSNKTMFYFGAYGDYLGGSQYDLYPSTWVCGKYIPYRIMGIGGFDF